MCQHCDKLAADQDIRESDLPNLTYKLIHWLCMVPGCRGKAKIRDYGLAPLYWWPVQVRRFQKDGQDMWRGGWIQLDHGYICSRHFQVYKLDPDHFFKKYIVEHLQKIYEPDVKKYLRSRVAEVKNQKLIAGYVTIGADKLKDISEWKSGLR